MKTSNKVNLFHNLENFKFIIRLFAVRNIYPACINEK